MPTAQQQRKELNAKRFSALLAGFDTGNTSEEEAMSKGRALRRMAFESGLRIVDALEMPEVKKAIDDQMQPKRQESRELEYALEELASLRMQLGERTTEVQKLEILLEKEKEVFNTCMSDLMLKSKGRWFFTKPCFGAQCWTVELPLLFCALTLMAIAAFR